MNKKLFFGMFAAASILFATSCSNDELEVVQSGNETQVSFSLGLEDGIGSRAISDGKSADVLVYAVFDKDGNRISTIAPVTKTGVTFPTTESITLAKGQTYKVAFWAQDADCKAYTVSTNTMTVEVDYANNNKLNNDETRDAFFKTVEFTVSGSTSIDVELKRPFAQINVGVYQSDWDAAVASGITIANSSVVIKNAANSLNLLDGTVSGSTAVSYDLNTIPNEPLKVDLDGDKVKEEYKWLSMSYILPADETTGYNSTTLDNVAFVFDPASGNDIEFKEGLNAVPAQRNWRTNIIGKLLTGDITFNISIDPIYEDDHNYPNNPAQELELAAKMGGTVTLTDDVKLEAPLNVVKDMVINLGDYTISYVNDYAIENTANLTINAENGGISGMGGIRSKGGKVIINGGTYTGSSDWNASTYQHILKAENTEVVINGGTFDATIGGITNAMINVSTGSKVTINGGEFRNVKENETIPTYPPYMFTYEGDGKLIINDGEFYGGWRFNSETATTDIYGGNFTVSYDGQSFNANSTHVLTVYGGTFSLDNDGKLNPTNYMAAGYYALAYETKKYTIQAFDPSTRTLTINSKDEFLKLNALNEKWAEFFSNGQGTDYSSYATQNGGQGTDFYYKWGWTIKLNANIDLGDITLDTPINISGWGTFDGQGNTIKNVNIVTSTTEETAAGLFTANSHCAIKNLVLDDIQVKGSLVGNSTAGILASDNNKGVSNITITNSSVWGGKYTGGVVGYGYADVTDCTLTNCVVKGGYKLGGVIGYVCASNNQLRKVDGHTLTDCTVNGTDDQYAGGKDKYIIGKIVGNYNANGSCENNTIINMTTVSTSEIGEIEAGLDVTGQKHYAASKEDLPKTEDGTKIDTNFDENITLLDNITLSATETNANSGYGATGVKVEKGSVLDGNENTLTVNDANGTWDCVINVKNGTIKNLTVSGAMRGIFMGSADGDVYIDNVIFKDVIYTFNSDGGNKDFGVYISKSTLNGWTSHSDAHKEVVYTNCSFGEGNGYAFCRPYGPTSFVNCKFEVGFEVDARGKITFENCTIGGVALTAENLATLVTSNTANATVK